MKKIICYSVLLLNLFGLNKGYGTQNPDNGSDVSSNVSFASSNASLDVSGTDGVSGALQTTSTSTQSADVKKNNSGDKSGLENLFGEGLFPKDLLLEVFSYLHPSAMHPTLPPTFANNEEYEGLFLFMQQRQALCADNYAGFLELIIQLMIGNIDAIKGKFDEYLISLGVNVSTLEDQKKPIAIAKCLAEKVMKKHLVTVTDLEDKGDATSTQGSATAGDTAPQTLLYLTQSDLKAHKTILEDWLKNDPEACVMMVAEPNEKGELKLSNKDLPNTLKHLHVVDPKGQIKTIGGWFCYDTKALQSLTLNMPALISIGGWFCSDAQALQSLTLNMPALTSIGESFCSYTQVLQSLTLNMPALTSIGESFCSCARALKHFEVNTNNLGYASKKNLSGVFAVIENKINNPEEAQYIKGAKFLLNRAILHIGNLLAKESTTEGKIFDLHAYFKNVLKNIDNTPISDVQEAYKQAKMFIEGLHK